MMAWCFLDNESAGTHRSSPVFEATEILVMLLFFVLLMLLLLLWWWRW